MTGKKPHTTPAYCPSGTVYVAFYRGRARRFFSLARVGDWVTRRVSRGVYSHCEIAIPSNKVVYRCYSASFRDGGVRCKVMPLPADKWDVVPVTLDTEAATSFFMRHQGKPYDWPGVLGFVFYNRESRQRWFCSEYCAAALGFAEPWRISPNGLHALLRSPSINLTPPAPVTSAPNISSL